MGELNKKKAPNKKLGAKEFLHELMENNFQKNDKVVQIKYLD